MLHEFTVSISIEEIEYIIEKLTSNGYGNLYYNQPIEQYVEPHGYGFVKKEDENSDVNIYVEDVLDVEEVRVQLASILNVEKDDIQHHEVQMQDWQIPFDLIDLGNGWVIKPPSIDGDVTGRCIHFEPPRAFGSGLHGTTQDCLRVILDQNLHGKKVLDLGTGSGLLSVAAALVGAEKITAVDIEDVEDEVLYNANLNGVVHRINVLKGNVLEPTFQVEKDYDWIFVNIGGAEIKALKNFLQEHLVLGGTLVLSGMVEWNYKEIITIFTEMGYEEKFLSFVSEWVTTVLRKREEAKTSNS